MSHFDKLIEEFLQSNGIKDDPFVFGGRPLTMDEKRDYMDEYNRLKEKIHDWIYEQKRAYLQLKITLHQADDKFFFDEQQDMHYTDPEISECVNDEIPEAVVVKTQLSFMKYTGFKKIDNKRCRTYTEEDKLRCEINWRKNHCLLEDKAAADLCMGLSTDKYTVALVEDEDTYNKYVFVFTNKNK